MIQQLLKKHAQTIHSLFLKRIQSSIDWREKIQKKAQLKRMVIMKTISNMKKDYPLTDLTDKIYDYYYNLPSSQ